MNLFPMILLPFAMLGAAAIGNTIGEANKAPTVLEAAGGSGIYSDDQRLVGRILLCSAAFEKSIPPSALTKFMADQKFPIQAQKDTLSVCYAYGSGFAAGEDYGRAEEAAELKKEV